MYNPSGVGKKGSLFGLPYSLQDSSLVLLPVNFDVTVSYGAGTAEAPDLILDASSQLDLSLPNVKNPWELRMFLGEKIVSSELNSKYRRKAKEVIDYLEVGGAISEMAELVEKVNSFCAEVHDKIEAECDRLLNEGKLVGIVGGEHAAPLGLLKSLSKRLEYGILQIDAHMDLRNSYEGFTHSHASIMYNAMKLDKVKSLTQVGIRDYCEEEERYIENSSKSIHTFFDKRMFEEEVEGNGWKKQVKKIVETLPENVYISFDIDGLDPSLCPNTGTPVPGGLNFTKATYLLDQVVKSGKKIVGFDLCEVGNGAWDANVGARVLFRLSVAMGVSQNLLSSKW